MHYIFSIFSFFLFLLFAILTLFNFSSSSIIVFLVQYFIPSNNFILFFNFHLIFFRFLKKNFHYIFLNSIVSLHSTFHLLPPFLFHLNFHINFFLISSFTPLSPIFFQVIHDKKVNTLSLSPILFLFWLIFFLIVSTSFFFFSTNGSFCYCCIILIIYLFPSHY